MRGSRRIFTRARAGALAACGALVAAGAATAYAHPTADHPTDTFAHSTLEQTIIGEDQQQIGDPPGDDFSFLRLGPGEPYIAREDLADAQPGRASRRRSLAYFAQLTDFQVADEESPARVEFLDQFGGPVSAAQRPQEALVAQSVEWSIRQVNEFLRSPVTDGQNRRARLVNAVMTGDLADNAQLNETEWVVQLLEGGTFVNGQIVDDTVTPNSGTDEDEAYDQGQGCPQDGTPARDNLQQDAVDDPYTGVQDDDDLPPGFDNPNYYDPENPTGDYAGWPTYEELLDRAQQPFEVEGLEVPSYIAFGNHDVLAQGNAAINGGFEDIATGCVKPIATDPGLNLGEAIDQILTGNLNNFQNIQVPPDPARRFVDKREFKQLFDTGLQPDEHGFSYIDQDEFTASNGAAGYYAFNPDTRGDLRFIVLDTVSEGGVILSSSEGNVDDPQFEWLRGELRRAQRRDQLIVVFGHHATESLNADVPDELAGPCTVPDEHGHDVNPGCDRDPRLSTPLHGTSAEAAGLEGQPLADLFREFPNVIAYVAGHSHENEVQAFDADNRGGEFWEIKSPAVVDWPTQHRLLEVMNNRDGTLSIFATLLDHASPSESPRSGSAAEVSGYTSDTLGSIGRTITFNDPQGGPSENPPEGAGGTDGPEGSELDRNVELLLQDPRRDDDGGNGGDGDGPGDGDGDGDGPGGDPGGGPGGGGQHGTGGGGGGLGSGGTGSAEDDFVGAAASTAREDLPFTGLALGTLALLAAGLIAAGSALRRRATR